MNNNYYDYIAYDYHLKRRYPWRPLEEYIQELNNKEFKFYGLNIDIGCANGRNFKLFMNYFSILLGIDNSFQFLKIAIEKLKKELFGSEYFINHVHVLQANILNLPIRPNKVQNIFSIATIHHLTTQRDRLIAIKQISQILTKNGNFLLTLWRKYQKKYRRYFIFDKLKRFFIPRYKIMQESMGLKFHGDKHIPWTLSKNSQTYQRFYHFFSKRELKTLLSDFKIIDISKRGGNTNKDNFFVISQKKTNDISRN